MDSYDCVEISWSPDNTYVICTHTCQGLQGSDWLAFAFSTIAVRDSHLTYRLLLYSLNGSLLGKYEAYEHALGLKSMAWSSSGQFLALGSFDDHLRILSHLNWKPIAEFDHESLAVTKTRLNKTAVRVFSSHESIFDSNRIV